MRYIYKHGNQYWYQRAVPSELHNVIGKKTLKISLKTNKVPIAIKRAKLQALEHKKMFFEIRKNINNYFEKLFTKKKIDINRYTLTFIDDYDDLVNKLLFSKKELLNFFRKNSLEDIKNKSLEKILLNEGSNNVPLLSEIIDEYFEIRKVAYDSKNFYSFKKSVSTLIEICGDKSLVEYSRTDTQKFQKYFIDSNKISTGKRNQSNIQSIFTTIFNKYSIDKNNPFSKLTWPVYSKKKSIEGFSQIEIDSIRSFCLAENRLLNLVSGLMLNTGCSFYEIAGLEVEDVNFDKFNPYIVIRSNKFRPIKNIYKRRIIPLVGISLISCKKIKKNVNQDLLFQKYTIKNDFKSLLNKEKDLNHKLKQFSNGKTISSFKYSIIDRLKEIHCPENIILDLIGQAKIEKFYKDELSLDIKSSWLNQIKI